MFGRRLFETGLDVLCAVDLDGAVVDANGSCATTLGLQRDDVVGRPAMRFVHPEDWQAVVAETARLTDGSAEIVAFETRTGGGADWSWVEWSARIAPDEAVVYAAGRIISERKEREAQLEEAALVDSLTGLANRRGFQDAFARQLAAARRYGQQPALIILDLDGFKQVNDRHGHQVGDQLLHACADALRRALRESDLAARIGGDEFAVLMPDALPATAELALTRVAGALGTVQVESAQGPVGASVSAGLAVVGYHGVEHGDDLLRAADAAMYHAKRAGRGYAVYAGAVG